MRKPAPPAVQLSPEPVRLSSTVIQLSVASARSSCARRVGGWALGNPACAQHAWDDDCIAPGGAAGIGATIITRRNRDRTDSRASGVTQNWTGGEATSRRRRLPFVRSSRSEMTWDASLAPSMRLVTRSGTGPYPGRSSPVKDANVRTSARSRLAVASRLASLGFAAVMFDAVAGRTAATQAVRRWSGYILHPSLAQVFLNAPDNRRRVAQPGRPMVRARRRCPMGRGAHRGGVWGTSSAGGMPARL